MQKMCMSIPLSGNFPRYGNSVYILFISTKTVWTFLTEFEYS